MSDATTPAVVRDTQQYDWRDDLDALNADAGLVGKHSTQFNAIRITAHIERLEAERDALQDALRWCSGSADFGQGGQAREGWQRQVAPLLAERVIRGE